MPGRSPVNFITQTLGFIILALFVLPGLPAYAAEVTLQWDQPDDDRVTGYYIYYGEKGYDFDSADPDITIDDPETTSAVLSDLEAGAKYEVAAKSFDNDDNESEFSEIVEFTAPEDDEDGDTDQTEEDDTDDSTDDGSNDESSTDTETDDDQEEEDSSSGDSTDTDGDTDLYHAMGFFHNGEFGTEYMTFSFGDNDELSIEGNTSSDVTGASIEETSASIYADGEMTIGDEKKGALSTNGNFFTLGDTGGQYPSTTFGIRQTSGLTASDLEGDYRVFLIKVNQDGSTPAETQKGVISADGYDSLSADKDSDLEFESSYYVNDETGHLSLLPQGGYSEMDGALSAEGRIFAAVDADDSDGTLLFIIGMRIPEDSRKTDPSGEGYYVNQFWYENEESPAGSFLELMIESDLNYESNEIDSTAGAVLKDSSGTLAVDETGLIQGESDNDGDNLSGAVAPGGNVLAVQDESLLGIGIRQSSVSSSTSGGEGGSSSSGCFIGTLSF
ncbi:MAG: fibronectin type III domain-containing protein [Desulfobacterales bacterium]